jgi:hypothetical protein
MMMGGDKIYDNFQDMEGSKMISPHHFHPNNGVRPSDSFRSHGESRKLLIVLKIDMFARAVAGAAMICLAGCWSPLINFNFRDSRWCGNDEEVKCYPWGLKFRPW